MGKTAQPTTVGTRLRRARDVVGYSQEAFAKRLSVRRETISDWEQDKQGLSLENLRLVSALLGVSADWLIHGTGTEPGVVTVSVDELLRLREAAEAADRAEGLLAPPQRKRGGGQGE